MLSSQSISHKNYAGSAVRRHPRLLYSTPLMFHHLAAGGVRSSHGISLDISESGIGALVEGRLEVGQTVGIDVPLPDAVLAAVAIVRYTSDVRSGLEFVGLTSEERSRLANLVGRA
jgi:PilZ domain-containing protein